MPACAVLIVGDSGSGKSSSMETLPPDNTFIINVSSKPLPFKGWRNKYKEFSKENPEGNLLNTDNADLIVQTINHISTKRPEIKHIIIDDSQYIAANEYMRRVSEKGFDKFVSIASNMHKIPMELKKPGIRNDLFVFFLSHADVTTNDEGVQFQQAKTIGRMINNTITYDGLFTIVLFTKKKLTKDDNVEYGFITNGDPGSTAKSPRGMFESKFIQNDLAFVVEKIKEYEEG